MTPRNPMWTLEAAKVLLLLFFLLVKSSGLIPEESKSSSGCSWFSFILKDLNLKSWLKLDLGFSNYVAGSYFSWETYYDSNVIYYFDAELPNDTRFNLGSAFLGVFYLDS